MNCLIHVFYNEAHKADFTLRVVGNGDRYGLKMAFVHEGDDPLVEFYDRRWDFDKDPDGVVLGQFVSRYRLSTLLEPDASGKTVFDTGIMLDGGNAWRVDAESMKGCLEALRAAGIAPSDPEELHEERIAALAEKLDALMNERLEHAETHKDAGDAYAHLPREGTWQYDNGDARLRKWMTQTGLDAKGLAIEEISELVLENFRMEPGSIFDPTYNNDDLFLVGSFPVGEIEEQIDFAALDPEATEADWQAAMTVARTHFSEGRGYLASDRVWYALIDRAELEVLIADAAADPDVPSP